MNQIFKRLLYLIPLALYLAFYGVSYQVLASRIPEPVIVDLPKPHYVEPSLKPLVDKYQIYGVDVYLDGTGFKEGQWGVYFLKKIYVRDIGTSLEIALTHEYIHYKQEKSPPINWRPFYESNSRFKQRMLGFYPTYSDIETEAVGCTEVSQLPEPYLTRCNSLIVNRSQLPFKL